MFSLESIWHTKHHCNQGIILIDFCSHFLSSKSALLRALENPKFNAAKILSALKPFILENLQEQTIAPSTSIHICLVNLEVDGIFLGDADWFLESFPESVTMSEIIECFDMVKEGQIVSIEN
jgi:hypothetical protein